MRGGLLWLGRGKEGLVVVMGNTKDRGRNESAVTGREAVVQW